MNKIIVSILLFCSHIAFAQSGLSDFDRQIYLIVYDRCSQESTALVHSLEFVDSMKFTYAGFGKSLSGNLNPSKQLLADRGLSPTTAALLESQGFFDALRACYPNDEAARDRFALNMIVADTLGRGVGSIQGAVSFIIGGRIFKSILQGARGALAATRFGKNLKPQNIKRDVRVAGAAVVSIATVALVREQYVAMKRNQEQNSQSEKEFFEGLNHIKDSLDMRLARLNTPSTSELECQSISREVIELKAMYLELFDAGAEMYDMTALESEAHRLKGLTQLTCNS